jgi:hypothetical protein
VRGAGELITSVYEMGGEIGLSGDRIHFRLPRYPSDARSCGGTALPSRRSHSRSSEPFWAGSLPIASLCRVL